MRLFWGDNTAYFSYTWFKPSVPAPTKEHIYVSVLFYISVSPFLNVWNFPSCMLAHRELGCPSGRQRAIWRHLPENGQRHGRPGHRHRGHRDLHAIQPASDDTGSDMVSPVYEWDMDEEIRNHGDYSQPNIITQTITEHSSVFSYISMVQWMKACPSRMSLIKAFSGLSSRGTTNTI